MQPLVNMHGATCPKCGAGITGENKSCGACGSVSCLPLPQPNATTC